MKVKQHLFSISKNLDSLLVALAGFVLIQIFSNHSGIGVSPDSVTYLSASRHLATGGGFRSFDQLPVVDFPVGYPVFLTIISFFTRLDPLLYGSWLNGILFGILLYTCGSMMNGFYQRNGWYKRILLVCILFSPALQEVYSMLWSETIFLLLILFFIISISNFIREMKMKWLFVAAIICSIACLDRYAGIFMVPVGVSLIFFNQRDPLHKRLMRCLLFSGISLSLFLINIIRNYFLTGFLMGQRQKGDLSFFRIIEYFGGVFCDWILVGRMPGVAVMLTLAVLVIFSLTIFFTYKHRQANYEIEYASAAIGLMYCVFMLLSSFLTRYEQFTNRLLAPMFIPLLWSLSWWIPGFIGRRSYRMKWISGFIFLLVAALFLNIQLAADYEYYDGVKDAGIPGYREDEFTQSGIVQFVEKNKVIFDPHFPIYSNAPDAVYFITSLPAIQLPQVVFPEKVRHYYESENGYLVWFNDLENPEMPKLDSILQKKNMLLLKQVPDGAVYFSK